MTDSAMHAAPKQGAYPFAAGTSGKVAASMVAVAAALLAWASKPVGQPRPYNPHVQSAVHACQLSLTSYPEASALSGGGEVARP